MNARIRKAWIDGARVGLIGPKVDLTYDYHHFGAGRSALTELVGKVTEKPDTIVIVGQGALQEADGEAVLSQLMAYVQGAGAKLLVLHTAAGRVGAMDVGAVTEGGMDAALEGAEVVYNLGADEVEIKAAHRADVILPGAAYTEEQGLFVNTEGRPQLALRAGFAPGEAKENWAILRALSGELGSVLPYDSVGQLRQALVGVAPYLLQIDMVPENEWQPLEVSKPGDASFRNAIRDHYLTNPIARASQLMAQLSAGAAARRAAPVAAE